MIEISITMFSIIYGFLVSSVCNLFGRSITEKLKDTTRDGKNTELHLFGESIVRFVFRGIVFLLISIFIIIARLFPWSPELMTFVHVSWIKLVISGYFFSQILFITLSMYYYFQLLVVMLINETYFSKTDK